MPRRAFLASIALMLPALLVHANDEKTGPNDNQPPAGFTALFNGKDLTNWRGLPRMRDNQFPKWKALSADEKAKQYADAEKSILPHWKVVDGVIAYDGKGHSLETVKEYGNFELMVDWKIEPNGDSGIYVRGQPQIQIWDTANRKDQWKGLGSGGLFNNQKNPSKPLLFADNPPGQWNSFHIIVKGDKVTVKLNGKLVVDDTVLENYFERGRPLPAKAGIELQHHGDKLWFKNIYVKELD